jgi:hypothetical protein
MFVSILALADLRAKSIKLDVSLFCNESRLDLSKFAGRLIDFSGNVSLIKMRCE